MLHTSSNSTSAYIDATLATAAQLGCSVAIWSIPGTTGWQVILSFHPITIENPYDLKEKKGFLFAPFKAQKSNSAFFIQQDVELKIEDNTLQFVWHDSVDKTTRSAFSSAFNKILEQGSHNAHMTGDTTATTGTKDDFISLTHKAINAIDEGLFEKVVLATNKLVKTDRLFSCGATLFALKTLYPDTLVSLMSTPEHGTWLGASPEILLDIDNNMKAKTVALAGTRHLKEGPMSAWQEKEYTEHQVVSRYLHDLVDKMKIEDYSIGEVTSFKVGNLVHLKQELQWPAGMFATADVISVMQELHPTPAVCGQPKDIARDFIIANEHFPRDFYAGFLGPVNYGTRLSAYVNIRCMRLLNGIAELFAGAGITRDSTPEHEWEEVMAKLNVMENALGQAIQVPTKSKINHV